MTCYNRILLLSLALFYLNQTAALCYYPDGTRIFQDEPCLGNGTEHSFCCGPVAQCLSDGMCYTLNPTPATYAYVRGSCTDPTWNSDACPKFCMHASDTFVPALDCHDPTKDAYCCSYGNKGCDCGAENITFPEPRTAVSTFDISDAKGMSRTLKAPIEGHAVQTSISVTTTYDLPVRSLLYSTLSSLQSSSTSLNQVLIASPGPLTNTTSEISSPSSNLPTVAIAVPVATLSAVLVVFLVYHFLYRRHAKTALRNMHTTSHLARSPSAIHELECDGKRPSNCQRKLTRPYEVQGDEWKLELES